MKEFQSEVNKWMVGTFSPSVCADIQERGDRALEELLELLQAHGYDPARVASLCNYTFSRPVGEPVQELGGVIVTLNAFATAAGLDMEDCAYEGLAYCYAKRKQIQMKQASKRDIHSPLPGGAD